MGNPELETYVPDGYDKLDFYSMSLGDLQALFGKQIEVSKEEWGRMTKAKSSAYSEAIFDRLEDRVLGKISQFDANAVYAYRAVNLSAILLRLNKRNRVWPKAKAARASSKDLLPINSIRGLMLAHKYALERGVFFRALHLLCFRDTFLWCLLIVMLETGFLPPQALHSTLKEAHLLYTSQGESLGVLRGWWQAIVTQFRSEHPESYNGLAVNFLVLNHTRTSATGCPLLYSWADLRRMSWLELQNTLPPPSGASDTKGDEKLLVVRQPLPVFIEAYLEDLHKDLSDLVPDILLRLNSELRSAVVFGDSLQGREDLADDISQSVLIRLISRLRLYPGPLLALENLANGHRKVMLGLMLSAYSNQMSAGDLHYALSSVMDGDTAEDEWPFSVPYEAFAGVVLQVQADDLVRLH